MCALSQRLLKKNVQRKERDPPTVTVTGWGVFELEIKNRFSWSSFNGLGLPPYFYCTNPSMTLFSKMLSLNLNVRLPCFNPGGITSRGCSVVTPHPPHPAPTQPPHLTPLETLARFLIVSHIQPCDHKHSQLNTCDVSPTTKLASRCYTDLRDKMICPTGDVIPRDGQYR